MRIRTLFAAICCCIPLPVLAADPPLPPAVQPQQGKIIHLHAVPVPFAVPACEAAEGASCKQVGIVVKLVGGGPVAAACCESICKQIKGAVVVRQPASAACNDVCPANAGITFFAAQQKSPCAQNNALACSLRNTAAADVEHSLNCFLKQNNLKAVVASHPVSNTVFISAEPDLLKLLNDMVAILDKPKKQITFSAMVVEVPRDFVARSGLNAGGCEGQTAWTLSTRETKMLMELIRAEQAKGKCDVLSRPTIQVCSGQSGFVKVGQEYPCDTVCEGVRVCGQVANAAEKPRAVFLGLSLSVTPEVAADKNSITLTSTAQVTALARNKITMPMDVLVPGLPCLVPCRTELPVFNTHQFKSNTTLRSGETLVMAGSGKDATTLVIITPVVNQDASKPAFAPAHWMIQK